MTYHSLTRKVPSILDRTRLLNTLNKDIQSATPDSTAGLPVRYVIRWYTGTDTRSIIGRLNRWIFQAGVRPRCRIKTWHLTSIWMQGVRNSEGRRTPAMGGGYCLRFEHNDLFHLGCMLRSWWGGPRTQSLAQLCAMPCTPSAFP